MKELVEAIRARGVGIGTDIVKVDMFLNHQLDTGLFVKMGRAFADAFAAEKPDLVLTVEASGIAAALTTARNRFGQTARFSTAGPVCAVFQPPPRGR